jgi:shikimate kinase
MSGVGAASAAITVVNALPTGIGCAIGVGLYARAEVTVRAVPGSSGGTWDLPTEVRTPLVEEALRVGLDRFFPGAPVDATLSLHSDIPVARGLKSSSAVASAILAAIARSARANVSTIDLARLAAEVGRRSGTSATGAFDDALAGLRPGFVVTDNRHDTVIREGPVEPDYEVALLVPPSPHRPSTEWTAAFRAEADEGARAAQAAREGRWWEAMDRNTELVERVMGYRYTELRRDLRRHGAVASGVSGLGPSLAIVVPRRRAAEILELLPADQGERLRVLLRTEEEPGGVGRP